MIGLQVTISGHKELQMMLNAMPGEMRHASQVALGLVSRGFVGKNTGAFWKDLKRKGREFPRSGQWSSRVANNLKSKIDDTALTVTMGLNINDDDGFKASLARMQTGGTESANDTMAVPIYANLQTAGLLDGYKTGRKVGTFRQLAAEGKLAPMMRAGGQFIGWKLKGVEGTEGRLLFVRKSQIHIKKEFDIEAKFQEQMPKIEKTFEDSIERSIAKLTGTAAITSKTYKGT